MPECPASIDGQGEEGSVPEGIGRMKCHVVRSMGGWNGQEEIEVSHCERSAHRLRCPCCCLGLTIA